MNKLKANGFWVAVGAAGAVVLVVFGLWVLPAWARQEASRARMSSLLGDIKRDHGDPLAGELPNGEKTSGIAGNQDIDEWENRRKDYVTNYQNIASFYKAGDKILERWFGDGAQLPYDQFKTLHADASTKLEGELRGRGIKIGLPKENEDDTKDGAFGFNWIDLDKLSLGDKPENVKELQRRFRICEHIARACKTSGLQVERLVDVHFFKSMGPTKSNASTTRPAGDSKIDYDYVSGDTSHAAASSGRPFEEWLLCDNGEKPEAPPEEGASDGTPKPLPPKKYLGQTITFGVTVDLPSPDAPKFIAELLSCQNSVIINLSGCRILARTQNDLTEPLTIEAPVGKEAEARAKKEQEVHQKIKPKAVQLQMVCQAIDFDESALPSKTQP